MVILDKSRPSSVWRTNRTPQRERMPRVAGGGRFGCRWEEEEDMVACGLLDVGLRDFDASVLASLFSKSVASGKVCGVVVRCKYFEVVEKGKLVL